MKRKFIINPYSGSFNSDFLKETEKYFINKIGSFDFILTGSRLETIQKTRNLLKDGIEQIIPLGGDGTVNAVANGFFENEKIINPDSKLVVAKAGTGTDYFRSIYEQKKWSDWRETVSEFQSKKVDVGLINYSEKSGFQNQIFINMASTGNIPEIVRLKEKLPAFIPKKLSYSLPTLLNLFTYKPKVFLIKIDKVEVELRLMYASFSKGKFAGGGMKFGPQAILDDGLLEVTMIEAMNPLKLGLKLNKMYSGKYIEEKGIHKYKGSKITVHCDSPVEIEFEGEVYGTTDINISVLPKALNVCFPI